MSDTIQIIKSLKLPGEPDILYKFIPDFEKNITTTVTGDNLNADATVTGNIIEHPDTGILSVDFTFSNIKGATGKTGPQGPNGKTPIKGEDYFTKSEIQNIIDETVQKATAQVIQKLPTWNGGTY